MKYSQFQYFKRELIKSRFTGDIMMCGALWLTLTDRQVNAVKALIPEYADEYKELPNGALQVGAFILK